MNVTLIKSNVCKEYCDEMLETLEMLNCKCVYCLYQTVKLFTSSEHIRGQNIGETFKRLIK